MGPSVEAVPSSLRAELDRCIDICRRLSAWSDNLSVTRGTGEPLTALVCSVVQTLTIDVLHLNTEIVNVGAAPRAGNFYLHPKLRQAIDCTQIRLAEALELLEFYQREDRHGHDGALNALFASTYILGNSNRFDSVRGVRNENKLIRIGLELSGLLTDINQKLDPSESDADVLERQMPKFLSIMSRIAEQFRPRYIHTYKSLSASPFALDTTGNSARGSFGIVQRVNHTRSGQPLAMKTFVNVFRKRSPIKILREIGVLEVCTHKNIVRLVEAFKTEDNERSIHLVMTPWAPYTLLDFFYDSDNQRKKRCPWFEPNSPKSDLHIHRIMHELADAVDYLHDLSIKHKDLKPENILIHQEGSSKPTPLITDVGVSKIFMEGDPTNFDDSTYSYLAPEQQAKKASTLKADVWQLGCCFAQLLVVARGGTLAHDKLLESYSAEEEGKQCSIALEHASFMQQLADICMPGNSAQKKAYAIITGMLDDDPTARLDIKTVKAAISKLPGTERVTATEP